MTDSRSSAPVTESSAAVPCKSAAYARVTCDAWTPGGEDLLSHPFLNFVAKRRIAISLTGFTALTAVNLLVQKSVPVNPFSLHDQSALLALVLLLLGLVLRSWSAGTLNKSREVSQQGPYAIIRNPMYAGSFLVMLAFCTYLRDVGLLLFVLGPLSFLYGLQVLFEEKRLRFLFPSQWAVYEQRVPRFLPSEFNRKVFDGWKSDEWVRNGEWKTIAGALAGVGCVFVWYVVCESTR